jgi:hypothetical protein
MFSSDTRNCEGDYNSLYLQYRAGNTICFHVMSCRRHYGGKSSTLYLNRRRWVLFECILENHPTLTTKRVYWMSVFHHSHVHRLFVLCIVPQEHRPHHHTRYRENQTETFSMTVETISKLVKGRTAIPRTSTSASMTCIRVGPISQDVVGGGGGTLPPK